VTITGVMDEPTGLVVTALRDIDLAIDRLRTAFAQRYRITINDSLVISHLSANDRRMRPSEIAARILVTSGTLTPMLDRLEAADFVRREPNPADRRSVHVVLTERGDRALTEYREQFRAAIEGAVPKSQRRQLAKWLAELSGALAGIASQLSGTDHPSAPAPAGGSITASSGS
jgi:DNA-binding MarR family transcriptional regulator